LGRPAPILASHHSGASPISKTSPYADPDWHLSLAILDLAIYQQSLKVEQPGPAASLKDIAAKEQKGA